MEGCTKKPDFPEYARRNDKAVLERVQARRGDKGLIPLDLALLHAPKVADGWNAHLGAIRTRTSLPDAIREIAICRVALINKAWFEWRSHAPLLRQAEGFNDAKLEIVKQLHPTGQGELSDKEYAVLLFADESTRSVDVADATFARLATVGFSNQEIVEITATVATYNMVSRFLVALNVAELNGKDDLVNVV
ncbi:hypothetical protein DV735_g5543, partial [Chaetothyriales sp. CBS 134920]